MPSKEQDSVGLNAEIESRLLVEKNVEQVRLAMNSLIFTSRFLSNDKSNSRNADMLFGTLQKRIAEFLSYFHSLPVCSNAIHLNSIKLAKLLELSQMLSAEISAIPKERGHVYLAPAKTELKADLDEKEISVLLISFLIYSREAEANQVVIIVLNVNRTFGFRLKHKKRKIRSVDSVNR